jgi:serine protease inhibitor
MTMDHPFFCAIRDDDTEALLFIGTVVAPGQ